MRATRLIILAAALAWLLPAQAVAIEYKGEIVKISDGDTVTLRAGNNRLMKIRLSEIDAPEKKQPFGLEAKAYLASLVEGQRVTVYQVARDRYKRTVGLIIRPSDGLNVNKTMVAYGNAWAYRAYLKDPALLTIEASARERELGLWSLPSADIIPPWEWRHSRRSHSPRFIRSYE